MKKTAIQILIASATLALVGCIKNDIPYPVVELDILSMSVDGALSNPVIDRTERTVNVDLVENIDIRNVNISSITYTEGAVPSIDVVGRHDMRYPQYVTLSLYQDYEWKITASQTIDRRFRVIGQIGETEWDVERNMAKVYRRADYALDTVTVTQLRFGPKPEYSFPDASTLCNFNNDDHMLTAMVESYGRTEIWRLIVEPKEVEIEFTRAVAGANVAWLRAVGVDGAKTGFRYRMKGATEWIETDSGWYDAQGGTIEARLRHLQPETEYEIIGYAISENETKQSDVITLKTTGIFALPNASFEDWCDVNDTLYPYLLNDEHWWGTGNPGSKVTGINVTTPFSGTLHEGAVGKCAQLWSQKASVLGIGKFAAGNMFTGEFAGVQGTNGLVNFGRPFTLRPTALRGWVKYQHGTINCVPIGGTNGETPGEGDPDRGSIYIALGDWDYNVYGGTPSCPYLVDTRDKSTFFKPTNEGIIAYGEILYEESHDWYQFTIPLEYRSFDRVPTHIIITCTGSSYGDYFVGSSSSIMWIDDFELLYDYE